MAFPPPPSMPPPPSPPDAFDVDADPPGRPAVFFHVLIRSLVAAVGGGVAIGVGFVLVVTLFGESWDDLGGDGGSESAGAVVAALFAAFFGALFGVGLGVLAGIVLGFVGAFVLVPYRGARMTRLVMRVGAPLLVAVFFLALAGGEDRIWLVLGGAGVVGAVLVAPWLVGWYVRRMEPGR